MSDYIPQYMKNFLKNNKISPNINIIPLSDTRCKDMHDKAHLTD